MLTFFKFAVLISESMSNHSKTWLPAIPDHHPACQVVVLRAMFVIHTLELERGSRLATKVGNRDVVPFVHEGAEHRARRRAVRVTD